MGVRIKIPMPLRLYTKGQKEVEVEGSTILEALQELEKRYPEISNNLYDKETYQPKFMIYLNDHDTRIMNQKEGRYEIDVNRPVKNGDRINIIPPIAGGFI